ncbi:uncharacterized protein LOC127710122 isoform X2 [Mytilus californianus]|nr:uncharacterized protein LOC127710122 isoform X2 [Mytilus californianus]
MQQPKEILACIFVRNSRNGKANEFEYYKVISSTSNGQSYQTFVQKCIGLYGCSTEELVQIGCKEVTLETSVLEKVINSYTKKDEKVDDSVSKKDEKVQESGNETDEKVKDRGSTKDEKVENCDSTKDEKEKNSASTNDGKINDSGSTKDEKIKDIDSKKDEIHNFFDMIPYKFESTSQEAIKTLNTLYDWLEKGYTGILPMRSIGPLQWTKSKYNKHENREYNYKKACDRAEILWHLLDNEKVDEKLEAKFSEHIVYPYKFSKDNDKILVSNSERQDLPPKPLLKTPEGIIEAKQLALILSHTEYSTITLEEPDHGMHPHMIKKLRDLILRRISGKTVLIITHNPSLIDKWAMSRTFVSSKSIRNETICHSICKVPKKYYKLCESDHSEEMKNLLFSSRILFVEGKTDKIIVEAIIRLLIHDDKIKKHRRISTEQKHFLLATDIRELAGCKKGPQKKRFCEEMEKEIYLLYDEDAKDKKIVDTKKTTIDKDTKMKTSNEDTKKKTSNEDAKRNTSKKDAKTKLSNENPRRKTLNEDAKKKTRNEDAKKNNGNESTFYWKNGDLEQRFIDILDDCNETTVVNVINEIFRMFCEEKKDEYNSIDNYLTYRKQIEEFELRIQAFKTPTGNDQTCATAELKNLEKEKNNVQKKIICIKETIKDIVKTRIILNADYEYIETIAEALIHHSKEIPEFIDFCSNNSLKSKHNEPEVNEVYNIAMQTLQSKEEDSISYMITGRTQE